MQASKDSEKLSETISNLSNSQKLKKESQHQHDSFLDDLKGKTIDEAENETDPMRSATLSTHRRSKYAELKLKMEIV